MPFRRLLQSALDAIGRSTSQAGRRHQTQTLADLETYLAALMRSKHADAFLIVEVEGTLDFLQFTSNSSGVQLDLPLLTERQVALESKFRSIAQELALEIEENKGSSGDRFLDINLSGDASKIAATVEQVFGRLYAVDRETAIRFECNACAHEE